MSVDTLTVVVSIGRGAHEAQEPLDDATWSRFRGHIRAVLSDVLDGVVHVDDAQSIGEWEGVPEQSSTFVAALPQHQLGALRAGLAAAARVYGQEAIALTVGTTEFVTGY